jgi:hypothetical protein
MSTPDETNEGQEQSIYWSVLHHKNVNAHDIHADVGIPRVIRHEKEPLVKESSTKSEISEVDYGSVPDENREFKRKWSRVRELVRTNELVSWLRA